MTMLIVFFIYSPVDLKAQPDPSPILSQLTQQQTSTLLSDLPAQGRNPSPPLPLPDTSLSVLKPLGDTSAPAIAESHQPKQIRPQRRRMPPPSKVRLLTGNVDIFILAVNTVCTWYSQGRSLIGACGIKTECAEFREYKRLKWCREDALYANYMLNHRQYPGNA